MVNSAKDRTRPGGHALPRNRPPRHRYRVESKTRLELLATLLRRARTERGIPTQKALAEMTGGTVSETTIARLESAARMPGPAKLNDLELILDLPLGTMDRVYRGELDTFPPFEGEPAYSTQGGDVFTRAELRTLAKALGPKAFIKWATGESEGPNG